MNRILILSGMFGALAFGGITSTRLGGYSGGWVRWKCTVERRWLHLYHLAPGTARHGTITGVLPASPTTTTCRA